MTHQQTSGRPRDGRRRQTIALGLLAFVAAIIGVGTWAWMTTAGNDDKAVGVWTTPASIEPSVDPSTEPSAVDGLIANANLYLKQVKKADDAINRASADADANPHDDKPIDDLDKAQKACGVALNSYLNVVEQLPDDVRASNGLTTRAQDPYDNKETDCLPDEDFGTVTAPTWTPSPTQST